MSVFYFWQVIFWLDVFVFWKTTYFGLAYLAYFKQGILRREYAKIRLLDVFSNPNCHILVYFKTYYIWTIMSTTKVSYFVVLSLSTPFYKVRQICLTKIRRIWKYEYTLPKYALTKLNYAHIWFKSPFNWVISSLTQPQVANQQKKW